MRRTIVCAVTALLVGIFLAEHDGADAFLEELDATLNGGECILPPKVTPLRSGIPPTAAVSRRQIRVSSPGVSAPMASTTEVRQLPINFSLCMLTLCSRKSQFSKTAGPRDHGCRDTAKGLLLGRHPRRQLSDCLTQPTYSTVIVSGMTSSASWAVQILWQLLGVRHHLCHF